MVMKCRFFVLTILSFFFMACYLSCSDAENNSNSEVPSIEMDDEVDLQPVIGSEGGTFTMTFTASADWTASVNAVTRSVDWLSISPTQGEAGTVTLQVSVQPNETYDERNAAVLLTCGNAKQTITVTQKQKDALLVSSNKVEMDATGGTFGIELQSNVSVSYEIEESAKSWLTASPSSTTRGLTASTLSFQVTENPDNAVRQAVITLRGNDLTEQVTVYQAGSEPAILLSQKEYTVPSDGETIQVELKSNTSYKVVMPDVPWITEASTRSFSAYTHYFTVAANEGYDARTAEIYFVDEENGLQEKVIVTQVQRDVILVAQNEYQVSCEASSLDLKVCSNIEIEYVTDVDWIKITQVKTRGLVENILRLDILANEMKGEREGLVTVRDEKAKNIQNIRIVQAGHGTDKFLVLSQDIYNAGCEEHSFSISVETNVSYEIVMPDVDWLYKQSDNSFSIKRNDSFESRTADILYVNKEENLEAKLVVIQAPREGLVLEQAEYHVAASGGLLNVKVQTNTEISIKIDCDWIEQVVETTRSLAEKTLCFNIKTNVSSEQRAGSIMLRGAEGSVQEEILVFQLGADVYMKMCSAPSVVSSTQQQFVATVESNTRYVDVVMEDDWLNKIDYTYEEKDDGTYILSFSFEVRENLMNRSRSTEICFRWYNPEQDPIEWKTGLMWDLEQEKSTKVDSGIDDLPTEEW